jgi:hypothetical protein
MKANAKKVVDVKKTQANDLPPVDYDSSEQEMTNHMIEQAQAKVKTLTEQSCRFLCDTLHHLTADYSQSGVFVND